jgi:hypothetical protein
MTPPRKTLPSLQKEASDPATDPERLRELSQYHHVSVPRAAMMNPSLPEDVWRKDLLQGQPEAWANPMAPFYVLTWTPREDDVHTLEHAALRATKLLWKAPKRSYPEGKALLAAKVQEWWATSEESEDMMRLLKWWVEPKGNGSPEHREAVRILIRCARTAPDLTHVDLQALHRLEDWSQGGEDCRSKVQDEVPSSSLAEDVCAFAWDPSYGPWYALDQVLNVVASNKEGAERQRAKAEHDRLMADLIRREMPVPPVVE